MQRRLRIESIPSGEAPLWVREKWVGLELPLAQASDTPVRFFTSGVLSGPKNLLSRVFALLLGRLQAKSGYVVEVLPALEVLEQSSAEAAGWWRDNAADQLKPGRKFMFQAKECRVVVSAAPNAAPTDDA